MHDHPSPTDYLYLAALAVGTAAATTCWYIHRETSRPQARRATPATPTIRPAAGSSRRPPTSRSRGRLALASPAAAEATARRRLLEAHLRDQLAAEIETRIAESERDSYARGYADGIARLTEGKRS